MTAMIGILDYANRIIREQTPVVAAARRWVAADAAYKAAVFAYDAIRESDPPMPEAERGDAMTAAVAAQRAAWTEQRAAAVELVAAVQTFDDGAMP